MANNFAIIKNDVLWLGETICQFSGNVAISAPERARVWAGAQLDKFLAKLNSLE